MHAPQLQLCNHRQFRAKARGLLTNCGLLRIDGCPEVARAAPTNQCTTGAPGQHGAELQLIEGACRPLGHRDDRSIPGSTGCSPTMDLSEKDAARSKWKLTQKRRQGRGRGSGAPSGRGRRGARAGGGAANDLGSNEDRCACRHRPPPPVPLPSALLLQNRLPLLQPADLLYLILSYHALPVLLQVPGCRGGGRGSRGGAGPCAAVGGR